MPYLKSSLPDNEDCLVKIVDRFGKKEGPYGAKFPYKIEWKGTMYDHDATMTEEKKLQNAKPGEAWAVKKKANSYGTMSLYWDKASGPSADALGGGFQAPPPVQMHQNSSDKRQEDFQLEKATHDYKLGLAGVVQAMLTAGRTDAEITGHDDMSPQRTASQWVHWIRDHAHEMASADAAKKLFADDPSHS